jgi:hypothetical protein
MPLPKPISKEDCLRAIKQTRSVTAAARYLNCSFHHLKRYMKAYKDEETGVSLFDMHKNQSGKGIPKFLPNPHFGKMPAVADIVNGVTDASSFKPDKIKHALIEAGYLIEQCYFCGYEEKRSDDGKSPLLMVFLDGEKYNFKDNNAQLCCYNCYFLKYGDIFSGRDLTKIESHESVTKTSENVDFQLDVYHQKKLKELDSFDPKVSDDPYDLVSRKK